MKQILVITAHPDDESFSCGGTIAKYTHNGYAVHLVVATQGEKGHSVIHEEISEEELANIRVEELTTAAEILGISSISYLGYKDKSLSKLEPGDIEDKIYRQMCTIIPDMVITFDTTGISNHSDHIRVCFATTFAFQKYAKYIKKNIELQKIEDQSIEIPDEPKLYYVCMPSSIASYLRKEKILPDEMFGKPWAGTPDKYITTTIDISDFSEQKLNAVRAHKTQGVDAQRYLDIPNHPLLKHEYFIHRMQGLTEVFMGKNDKISSEL
jgi:N-acetylglucosamine malate deacetylase 2